MDLEKIAAALGMNQEDIRVSEELLALREAAQAVLDDNPEQAGQLHRFYWKEDRDAFMALSLEHPDEVACGLVGYWHWVLSAAVLPLEGSGGEKPLAVLRRRDERVLRGHMRDVVEEACSSRLSLYEVQAVDGLRVQILDLLVKGAEPVWVEAGSSRARFFPWDIHGMRILGLGGRFRASNAVHCFTRGEGLLLARTLRIAMKKNTRLSHPLPWGLLIDLPIARAWIDSVMGRELLEDPQEELEIELLDGEGGEEKLRRRLLAWAGEANELLDGKTPAQAARLARKRFKVVNMLKSFEYQDALRVAERGGQPFSFRFLWEKLGLNPSMSSMEER